MTTSESTACTKCVELGWKSAEPVVYSEDSSHYCVFHAPTDKKGMPTEDFYAAVRKKISLEAYTPSGGHNFSGTIFPGDIDFSKTTISRTTGKINFRECIFTGKTSFKELKFRSPIDFTKSTFKNTVSFFNTTFQQAALFVDVGFEGEANFSHASFSGITDFINTCFKTNCIFRWATISTECDFSRATFDGKLEFHEAHVDGKAIFKEAAFNATVDFHLTEFKGNTSFSLSTFKGEATFVQAIFRGETVFNNTTFSDAARFHESSFNDSMSFRDAHFLSIANFSWCAFFKTATFISTVFDKGCDFSNATFNGNGKFFNCMFTEKTLFTDLQSISELRFSTLDLGVVNLLGTPLNNIWFQELKCPKLNKEYRYQIPQEDEPNMYTRANDFYRQMKRHHKDRQNDAEASLWHFSEKEAQLKHSQSLSDNRFLLAMLKAYRISSRYGENPLQAMKVLSLLLIALFVCLLCGVFIQYGTSLVITKDCIAKFFLTFFQYILLLRPEWTPPKEFEIIALIISRLLIPIQAALLAFAIRNKFMR